VPRRKELKSILSGILGSFNSRNNDLGGYWAMGKIYLSAQQKGISNLEFDFLNANVSPNIESLIPISQTYNKILLSLLNKHNIPRDWLVAATLEIIFNCDYEKQYHYFGKALGDRYLCKMRFDTDLGVTTILKVGGICWAHDPKRESKRAVHSGI
jgi:hypothetical protein